MQYYRWLAFLGVGDIDVHLTNLHAMIASVADVSIENDR
jgi:hypothetical protein